MKREQLIEDGGVAIPDGAGATTTSSREQRHLLTRRQR